MEALIVILISYIGGIVSHMIQTALKKDDGIFSINEDKCEVIFRDPYEKLIKKKRISLRNKS